MGVMLSILKESNISGFDADTINKATCLNILTGSDSITVSITWALCLLVNNPDVLKKAQHELDNYIGKERKVNESDIKNLVYLQAILKESMRLYPASAFINIRAAKEDCTFSNGYRIPQGTQLMVNLWKIQRDERLWAEPDKFQPERFLGSHKDIDVKGQNYELLPFGSGRRSCAGIALALQIMHLTLALLLHSFEISTPSNAPVDMTESSGLTNMKATPLEVLLFPRLSSKLYEN
ncbi:hypothetical protein L6164_019963 [Bauhinia variegata]|uniref:Uncharacterized protein n=1 Tax=Bauhinia variegata TaxID=167791 RepID=A0ACB9MUW1_BAUVA|nr:hypothetical protein L6164_019963 [Bauhinia variegata]